MIWLFFSFLIRSGLRAQRTYGGVMKKSIVTMGALFLALIIAGEGIAAQPEPLLKLVRRKNTKEVTETNKHQGNPELLFIQTAEEAVITADPRTENQYILTMRNVKPHIAYFTDKPHRLAGKVSIEKFLARWNEEGDKSFKNSNPHASFVSSKSGTNTHTSKAGDLVSLSRPKYNPRTQTLTYIIKPHTHQTEIKEGRHQNPVLFIDEMNWPGFF